jgi:hypothetical protein
VIVQGGNAWQIGEDSGEDVYWDKSIKDRMATIGGGLGYWFVPQKFYANARYTTSYNNRQHFKTNAFQIELIFATGLLKKKQSGL